MQDKKKKAERKNLIQQFSLNVCSVVCLTCKWKWFIASNKSALELIYQKIFAKLKWNRRGDQEMFEELKINKNEWKARDFFSSLNCCGNIEKLLNWILKLW